MEGYPSDRLDRAAVQVQRLQKIRRRLERLTAEHQEEAAELTQLRARLRREERDVARLEGASLTGLFYAILGSKEAQLDRERQEALAARLRHDEAEQHVAALAAAIAGDRRLLADLDGAEAEYQQALAEKAAAMQAAAGPGARELHQRQEAESAAAWKVQQLQEAIAAGHRAEQALAAVSESLDSARGWGTWDMLGGGLIATAVKHSRMDDARDRAHIAHEALADFRRELQDVSLGLDTQSMHLDGFARFADYFFDGLITDWIIQNRINASRDSVARTQQEVAAVLATLAASAAEAEGRLEQARTDRRTLIERYQL